MRLGKPEQARSAGVRVGGARRGRGENREGAGVTAGAMPGRAVTAQTQVSQQQDGKIKSERGQKKVQLHVLDWGTQGINAEALILSVK